MHSIPPEKVLAVIPARGGSKGIPRKNLVQLGGRPLLVHSIEHARSCASVGRVIVSTEDREIAEVALAHGAEVPFLRPAELAADQTLDHPVFEHVLAELLARENYQPELIVHLRPTAPHRRPQWIDESVASLARDVEADSLRSVSLVQQHPYRVFEIRGGLLVPVMGHRHAKPYLLRRQDLPPMYYYNCVIDVTRPKTVLQLGSMTGEKILPFVMDPNDVIDVDSMRDLTIARALFWGGV
jgi:CMP-N,N'-diacetyllegionaminic acid synthase